MVFSRTHRLSGTDSVIVIYNRLLRTHDSNVCWAAKRVCGCYLNFCNRKVLQKLQAFFADNNWMNNQEIASIQLISPPRAFGFPLSKTEVKYWLSDPDLTTTLGGLGGNLQYDVCILKLDRPISSPGNPKSKCRLSGFVAKVFIGPRSDHWLVTLPLWHSCCWDLTQNFNSSRKTWSPRTQMQVGPTSLNVQNRGLSLGVEHPGSLNDRIMVGFPPENEIHHNFSF